MSDKAKKIIGWIPLIVLTILGLYFGYRALKIVDEEHREKVMIEQAREMLLDTEKKRGDFTQPEEVVMDTKELPLADCSLKELKEINSDIIGWIFYPGTEVDYPIMKGSDNNYYLYRDMNGVPNNHGTPFMDWHNQIGGDLQNYVIYGHHFVWGTAGFTTLTYAMDQEFIDEHPAFYLLMEDGLYECQIFSVHHTNTQSGYDTYSFASQNEKEEYIKTVMDESFVMTDISVSPDDMIITLSTCDKSNGEEHGRLAIHARMILCEGREEDACIE